MDITQSNDISSAYFSPTFEKDGSFYVDKPVGSMSISPCGRDVVLASRHGLHIIDLDSPWRPPRHLPHLTPWEVADVQWSPFSLRDFWVVSTSNQKALVWNLAMSTPQASIEHVLHGHKRAITDVNFSAHHPDVLSTCAVDGLVHCWDLRHPARPAVTFCDWFAGATQVKWNRQDPHIIASSHDKMLRIWDDRKGASPLRSIEAHDTKIYGIDWNRTRTSGIVTCSLDHTIKFWDYLCSGDEPERIIQTPFPVWRARHTPFGLGLLAMPQRGNNNVHLYDRRFQDESTKDSIVQPVKEFHGHEDQVKEFLWRPRGNIVNGIDDREFQLVTWGNDKTLRLHSLHDQDLADVGYHRGAEAHSRLHFTRQNAQYKTFREDPSKSGLSNLKNSSATNQPFLGIDSRSDVYGASVGTIIPSPSTRVGGRMGGGFVNYRNDLRGKAGARKDLDPIAWMKGVKIGRREVLMDQSATSAASPNFRTDRSVEEFEELGEEITHVGSKFTKVEFPHIDVQNRFVKFSLYGPWGPKHQTAYLDCRLDFPKDYPQKSAPIFHVEKTASIDAATLGQIQTDVSTIGETSRVCKRSSLEALIRYLQGDQSLSEILASTKEDQDTSVFDFAEGDGSSSSDDEDDIEFPGTQTADFGLAGSGVLSASNANTNVPLPRTCGAIWSTDGRLVCFFPPKEERPTSLAGSLGLEGPALLLRRRRKIFEGFGRVHKLSSVTKSKTPSTGTIDSEETDSEYYSDSSDFSSSSSSVSSKGANPQARYFGPQPTFRTNIFGFPRADKATDEAQRSVASGSVANRIQEKTKSLVSVQNLEALLPSKQILAQEYILSGPNSCSHNSNIARAHGLHDTADVWSTLDMLLRGQVPVRTVPINEKDEATSGFRVSRTLRRHDSGVDLSVERLVGSGLTGSVKWGNHPLGRAYLVEELFRYFARIADIQMLGIMSCILYSVVTAPSQTRSKTRQDVLSCRSPTSQVETLYSPAGTTPARTDYFPSIEVALSVIQADKPSDSSLNENRRKITSTSLASSLGASSSDPKGPISAGLTPPSSFRSFTGTNEMASTIGVKFDEHFCLVVSSAILVQRIDIIISAEQLFQKEAKSRWQS
ncbi:MAG: hypothetical protein MMC23_008140 [Stictis urceolatum]|nr:hypothetical protein [Stictis urceolata]